MGKIGTAITKVQLDSPINVLSGYTKVVDVARLYEEISTNSNRKIKKFGTTLIERTVPCSGVHAGKYTKSKG